MNASAKHVLLLLSYMLSTHRDHHDPSTVSGYRFVSQATNRTETRPQFVILTWAFVQCLTRGTVKVWKRVGR